MSDVVITGMGAVTPHGNDVESTWAGLVAGRSAVAPITSFDHSRLSVHIAAEVRGVDAEEHLGAKRARRTARFSLLAIVAAREAAAHAGLDVAADPERVGVLINSALGGTPETEENLRLLREGGPREVSPYYVPSTILNMPACEVAIDQGIHGPVSASALACASGTYALLDARRLILAGEADVVLAGGTDAGVSEAMFAGLSRMGPMSTNNDDPEGASRPFAADRDGFVFGEGAVVFVVESAEHAAARGATVHATIAGGALTSDAFHQSAPDFEGRYAGRAITQALERTGLRPQDVDYICAHGTGTRANDLSETKAIHHAFGEHAESIPVSSPKSMVGHLIGAAGALSVLCCVLGMRDAILPPTINLDEVDPECPLDHIANVAREATVTHAVANAFGFGGQNCVVVLKAPGA